MQTESTLKKVTLDRVAVVSLVRAIDIEEIAAGAVDGMISKEALENAGTFIVQVEPNGRGAKPTRTQVANEAEGLAVIRGFEMCVALKKKAPRKEKKPVDPAERDAAAKKAADKKAAAKKAAAKK